MQEELLAFSGLDRLTKELIGIHCQPAVPSRKLGAWLASAEFEALPSHLTCMAAAAGSTVRFADVPEALIPRLRGIVKYIHTLNSGMFSGLCLLGTACNQAQIQMLLLEDTALYMRYGDAPQRHLWQVCIGVRTTRYEDTLKIAQKSGFAVERHPYAAVARRGVTQQIVIRPLTDDAYLWNGATELKKGNTVFLCPQAATMLIELCQRTFRALTKPNPQISLVHWCMDMKVVLGCLSDGDWLCAKKIAQSEQAQCHIRFLLALYTAITGEEINETELFGTQTDVKRTLNLLRAYVACPKTGQKLRRAYLLYRLRRPDCVAAALWMLMRLALRKIKG